jgi:hypothetical protein
MDPSLFYTLVDHLGLPMALLIVLGFAFWRILRAVWDFMKPLITQWFDKHFALIDTVIAKAGKVDAIEAAGQKCLDGHNVTHGKLDQIMHLPPPTP